MIDNILYNEVSLPPFAEYFLKRPRIDDLLKNAVQRPLTTVIAGAGYGKTQAVSSFLESRDKKAIWFQLSELDNLIARLWERIIYGFKKHDLNLANSLKVLGYPESIAAFDKFLHLLAESITDSERLIIVFDDFYLIHNETVLNFLNKLIIARVKNLSVILISRTKPKLNLTEMFSKGLLEYITEEDLRFSYEEIKAYFENQSLNLNDKALSDIYLQTEGWILAAYLVALAIKKGDTYKLQPVTLAKIDIFDLIEKEIFAYASVKLQQLLLKFALLDIVPKKLLIELSGHDNLILTEITKISLLMRYDSYSDSYRIHNLFRDFLLERKNTLTNEQINETYRIAAQWYEKNNYKPEAINHYEKCNDYDKIFDIIMTVERQVAYDVADSFIRLIEKSPKELISKRPVIQVAKAHYLMNNNKVDRAYEELTNLRKQYESLSPSPENQSVLGEIYIILALISIINQNYEFEELFKMADSCLPNGSALIDYRMNIADGINICGIKNPSAGELEKYFNAMLKTMPLASKVMNGCCFGAEYLNAADSYFMTGNMPEAEKNAFHAIFYAREKLQYGIEYMANFILLRIYVLRGDYIKVTAILKQMKEQLNVLQIADLSFQYDIIEGWFFVKISEIDKIAKWIIYEEEKKKVLPPVTLGREYLVRSDSFLAQGRYNELLAFMELTDDLYTQRGILYAIIQNKITRAIIYHYTGDHEASVNALTEAYELSNPNNLIIQYIEYGNQMRTVINAARQNKKCKIPIEWLDNIYTKSSSYSKQLSSIVKAYKTNDLLDKNDKAVLSKREKEILISLSNGLTRSEIANSFNLSINTIKTTLQNIYSKLGASNSADAIRIAAEMKLI